MTTREDILDGLKQSTEQDMLMAWEWEHKRGTREKGAREMESGDRTCQQDSQLDRWRTLEG